jgi:hypothetical protein
MPGLEDLQGFKGNLVFVDRESGKTIGISFWESDQAMRDAEVVTTVSAVADPRSPARQSRRLPRPSRCPSSILIAVILEGDHPGRTTVEK